MKSIFFGTNIIIVFFFFGSQNMNWTILDVYYNNIIVDPSIFLKWAHFCHWYVWKWPQACSGNLYLFIEYNHRCLYMISPTGLRRLPDRIGARCSLLAGGLLCSPALQDILGEKVSTCSVIHPLRPTSNVSHANAHLVELGGKKKKRKKRRGGGLHGFG